MAKQPQLLGYTALLGDPVPSKWDRVKQALWETNLAAPIRGIYGLMNADPYTLYSDTGAAGEQAAADSFDAASGAMVGGSVVPKPTNSLNMGLTGNRASPYNISTTNVGKAMNKTVPIRSLDQLRQVIGSDGNYFVRWSAGPQYDLKPGAVSRDYTSGDYHAGLSALPISPDLEDDQLFRMISNYSFLQGKGYENNAPHIYSGKKVGIDSDGAPSIKAEQYIGTIDKNLVSLMDDPHYQELLDLEVWAARFRNAFDYYQRTGTQPPKYGATYTPEKYQELMQKIENLKAKMDSTTLEWHRKNWK